jgi:predicted MFS family arabinose efflux permease
VRSLPLGMQWSLWAAIYLGIAAATLPAVLPVMVGVMTDQLGFGLERAGYIASANMGGVALGSIVGAGLTRRLSWTTVINSGAAVMIGANALTMSTSVFSHFATLRFTSGLGEGLVAGICYAAMGQSGQATRALAFYAAGQGLVGAVGMGFIPTVIAHLGWQVLFVLISVLALPAFWLARRIGLLDGGGMQGPTATNVGMLSWLGWAAVGTLLAQFIGLSSIWAFLERLGHAKGIDTLHLSLALSASAIANMAGCLAVGLVAHRLGELRGMVVAFALFTLSLAGIFFRNDWQVYLATGVLFMLSWSLYFPFQFGLLATFDRRGTLAAIMPAVTGTGLTVGPALGGVLLARAGTGAILGFGLGCVLISTLACIWLHARFVRGT